MSDWLIPEEVAWVASLHYTVKQFSLVCGRCLLVQQHDTSGKGDGPLVGPACARRRQLPDNIISSLKLRIKLCIQDAALSALAVTAAQRWSPCDASDGRKSVTHSVTHSVTSGVTHSVTPV
jgi:hypothetical protein